MRHERVVEPQLAEPGFVGGRAPVAPKVSVIMIFLDEERFMEEAIASVFAQTFSEWELLLVDDGSSDGSSDLAKSYAARFPDRVRYLEHEGRANRGMSASRNLGLLHARGDYIALLDADDVYLPRKLFDQVALLDSLPEAGMVYGRTLYWFSWTGKADDEQRDHLTAAAPRLNSLLPPPEPLVAYLRHETYFPCTCGILLRRSVLESVGGFEEPFRGTYEDMVLYSKVFLRSTVYAIDHCWDYYRQHPDSCWAVAVREGQYVGGKPNPARLTFLLWLERYLGSVGMSHAPVAKVVRQELYPYRHPILHRPVRLARKVMKKLGASSS